MVLTFSLVRPCQSATLRITKIKMGCIMQVLTSENVRALRESILTLTRTMEHIEGISGDVGGLTGDAKVKAHVRQLVEALSRIVAD